MVVISESPTADTGNVQDRNGWPFMNTVQAPALGNAASEFRTSQAYRVAYDPKQGRVGKNINRPRLAVDLQRIGRHAHPPETLNLEAM
jgi:hypothetical protein